MRVRKRKIGRRQERKEREGGTERVHKFHPRAAAGLEGFEQTALYAGACAE